MIDRLLDREGTAILEAIANSGRAEKEESEAASIDDHGMKTPAMEQVSGG